jgi:hypothetical protein
VGLSLLRSAALTATDYMEIDYDVCQDSRVDRIGGDLH